MCGIAGFVSREGASVPQRERLQRMCDAIVRRGPDAEGQHVDGRVHLGHRRLSIIDLDAGQQPMVSDDGQVALIFNGEIYNHAELRQELEQRGVRFETRCDTEVILRLYLEDGEACVQRLRGMFAFAIWDRRSGQLLLVRDRVGIKPLYYARTADGFVFGSELKALLATGWVSRERDLQALDDFFAHGFIRASRSVYRQVSKLGAGELLRLSCADGSIARERYWQLPAPGTGPTDPAEAQAGLLARIDEAVRIRLMSDVPLGAFLSGGIDSSTVVWRMAEHSSAPVDTFSIGFDDERFDETPVARAVAKHFGTRHHEQRVTPDALQVLPRVIAAHDEPFGDPSSIPTWYVCQVARRDVTVCLSGDGGDELFAGYGRYATLAGEAARLAWPRAVRTLAARLPVGRAEGRTRNKLERIAAADAEEHYARFRAIFSASMREQLWSTEARARIDADATAALFEVMPRAWRDSDSVGRMQACDFGVYLPDDVLTKVDRMSMDHSLEARVPLLDHEVVEYAFALPTALKYQPGRSKAILRDLIEPHLPRAVLEHRKQGFSVPLSRWMRGPLAAQLRALPERPAYREGGLFEPSYVRRLVELHLSGEEELAWPLWQLLIYDAWEEAQE